MKRQLVLWLGALLGLAACASTPDPSVPPNGPAQPIEAATAAKVLIDAEGMVALTATDLQAVGWGQVDLAQLRVTYAGAEQPVWVDNGALKFYAAISPTRYMTESVYWLWREPARVTIQTSDGAANLTPIDHYTATARAEENRTYAPQVSDGDHWLWAQLPAPASRPFTVTLSAVAPGPAQASLVVWASTDSGEVDPDHHYRISLNGQPVADETWDGRDGHTLTFDIPAGVLRDGDNIFTIDAPGDTGVAADTTAVDRIEVAYPRYFQAEQDALIFDGVGGTHALAGFSGAIQVFDITQPDRVVRIPAANGQFASEAGRRYVAVGAGGYRSGRVVAAQLSPDLSAQSAIDYVAIAPQEFIAPLQPLLAFHAARGLKTLAVPVEAVYDQFGEGRVDPVAIRAWLRQVKPRYALLVGDASYDTLSYTVAPEANRLPTFLVQTVFGGETGSDVGFAQLDADETPDMAVGRVPARSVEQVRAFVDKTLKYVQSPPPGEWRGRVLAVADGQEPTFKADAQAFLDQFASLKTELISPPANTPGSNQTIIDGLNGGHVLVAYFGHGSVTQWGKDNLFTVKDSAALRNGQQLPVIFNFTCLTGLFTHPRVQSLSETLLWQVDGGAVALIAPSSLTLATDQSFLSTALVEGYVANPQTPIGDLLLAAWRAVPQHSTSALDVLRTFLLFGDPALVLAQPVD